MNRRQCCLFRLPGVDAKETGAHDKSLEKTVSSNRAWLLHKPFGTRVACSRSMLEKPGAEEGYLKCLQFAHYLDKRD